MFWDKQGFITFYRDGDKPLYSCFKNDNKRGDKVHFNFTVFNYKTSEKFYFKTEKESKKFIINEVSK